MASPSTPREFSDDESDSSSIVYKHEPFVTFRSRVSALAVTSIWPGSVPDEITIERMRGGGFSRIIGLTQHHNSQTSQTDTKTQYVLRIPRFDAAHIENEVASVQFLRQHTNIPAPEVVAFDETDQNALGSPYAVQIRVDGTDLHSAFPKLSHIQRCRVARELGSADGWFADTHYSLAHLDLAPRNILINPTLDVQTPIISAVLDCDNAVLAPMFMSCAPPMWIWAWNDDEDEDERTANDEPPTQEGVQLKLTFEEAAGPDYVRFAYKPAYRLVRRLLRFAIDGMRSNEDFEEAEAMLQEWIGIRQARKKAQDQQFDP
ncbi:hypothetical protein EDB80DRAFT_747407 [Ilyonectria destructans]|nr:hypothetical protein EDB80DRAFT_747407 [Ilyonectria destructans]